jgi:hypothetical protein
MRHAPPFTLFFGGTLGLVFALLAAEPVFRD